MYNVKRNNFLIREDRPTVVYTPAKVSEFLFDILNKEVCKESTIFDPCVGGGSLIAPWKNVGYSCRFFDITEQGFTGTEIFDYLLLTREDMDFTPDLVLINPPFNTTEELRRTTRGMGFGGRPLIPEVFLQKTLEIFGRNIKIALFTPYGFRLNVDQNSKRLCKSLDGIYPEISSIVSLPKDIYEKENVKFHSEILLFNTKKTKPHYFIDFRVKEK